MLSQRQTPRINATLARELEHAVERRARRREVPARPVNPQLRTQLNVEIARRDMRRRLARIAPQTAVARHSHAVRVYKANRHKLKPSPPGPPPAA